MHNFIGIKVFKCFFFFASKLYDSYKIAGIWFAVPNWILVKKRNILLKEKCGVAEIFVFLNFWSNPNWSIHNWDETSPNYVFSALFTSFLNSFTALNNNSKVPFFTHMHHVYFSTIINLTLSLIKFMPGISYAILFSNMFKCIQFIIWFIIWFTICPIFKGKEFLRENLCEKCILSCMDAEITGIWFFFLSFWCKNNSG